MTYVAEILRSHPELAVFLSLGLGFLFGKLRVRSFVLGPVLGTMFAGLLIGQLGISLPSIVKIIFFDMFLFATGYKVGPQFFRALSREALPQVALTLVISVSALVTAWGLAKILGYDIGTAAGLLAGAFTESTVIGTASEAIARLPITDAEKLEMINRIPVSYAVTYLIGTTSVVWFLPELAPRIIGRNLRDESRKLEVKLLGKEAVEPGVSSAFDDWGLRAFRVSALWNGLTVGEAERSVTSGRILIERIRHMGTVIEPDPMTVIREGDTVAIAARQNVMIYGLKGVGDEIFDRELLDFPRSHVNIIITKKSAAGRTLSGLGEEYGHGIRLIRLVRSGIEMPVEPGFVVTLGDVLQVAGRKDDVERAAGAIGYLDKPSPASDIMLVSLGIVIGGLIGMLSVNVLGISLTLTTSGGALVMGLVLGWMRSRRPTFGSIPDPALWIFDTLGLALFLGAVGISAGPGFIDGLRQTGFGLLAAGLVVALLPHVIGLLFGFYVLRINPVILLGAQSGAGTNTTALKILQDRANSKLPALGYTVPYALGNIVLTAWGPVIVAMLY